MKKCLSCNKFKALSEFYKHSQMKDGYLNQCKDCKRNDAKKYRNENIEKIREYDRNRPNKDERAKKSIEYHKTQKGKEVRRKSTQAYRDRNPLKYQAHNLINNAVKNGLLIQINTCESCGTETKTHGHHDDYSMPLDVRWLCNKCHRQFHKTHKLNGTKYIPI